MRFDGVINRFLFESVHSRRITINGDGQQYRSFVSIDRAASITANLTDASLKPACYNMVDRSYTINEIADHMAELFDGLERTYINQDLQLHHQRVKSNPLLAKLATTAEIPLTEYLPRFAKRFSL